MNRPVNNCYKLLQETFCGSENTVKTEVFMLPKFFKKYMFSAYEILENKSLMIMSFAVHIKFKYDAYR